jgi:hypothetical protein
VPFFSIPNTRFLSMRRSIFCFLLGLSSFVAAEQVVISEVMYNPPAGKPEFIELTNLTVTPLDCAKWRFSSGVDFTFPDYAGGTGNAHFIKQFERIVLSAADEATTRAAYPAIPAGVRVFGPWTGALDNAGEEIRLEDKNGVPVTTLKYSDGGRWPKAADGAGHSIVLRNENVEIDNWRNWRQSVQRNGTPGYAEFAASEAFAGNPEVGVGVGFTAVNLGDQWKYLVPTSDPGTAWRGVGFNDAGWANVTGLAGFETAGLPSPGIASQWPVPGNPKPLVYLFRKTFTFSGNPVAATFAIDQIVDDGAFYYLNGQPLGGLGANTGGLWNGTANRTVGDATLETNAVTGNATSLVNGLNVLAVEARQVNDTSSDFVFGAKLTLSTLSSVVINEVKPGALGEGFIEFYNTTGSAVNLNGYFLTDNPAQLSKFPISSSLVVPANGYATLGFAEMGFTAGATTTIYLSMPDGTTAISALSATIPRDGRSLGRNPAGSTSWFLFASPSPGSANGSTGAAAFSLRLSEVHFDAQNRVDWVELQNTAAAVVNTAGLWLASKADFSDKVSLSGSVGSSGYASWNTLFPSDANGNVTLYLIDGGNNVMGIAELERVAGRDSLQAAYPTPVLSKPSWQYAAEQPWWHSFATDTRDAANAAPQAASIVINEIMPDPPSEHQNGQFIELHNKAAFPVSLTGWKLRGGVDFDFAAGTSIAAGGYLVVGKDTQFLQATYSGAPVAGPWSGSLSNDGELIRVVDQFGNLVDEVDYRLGGDWPDLASGLGSSLELVHPNADNSVASAWRASNESNKSAWQSYTISGTWSQLTTDGAPADYKELHLMLAGDSHVALRNFNLRPVAGGANLLPNGGTTIASDGSSANAWLCQGTHWASYMDGTDLRLVADGHGDNRPNRAEIDVTGMNSGTSYLLTFDARWVSGKNRLTVQTWDHSFGGSFALPIPNNLGTAGAANSTLAAVAPPQVDYLIHSPAVPKPSEPVKVTARVVSANPLTSVQLFTRVDDINNDLVTFPWSAQAMFDNGTNGDAVEGDGLYTATVTAHQVNQRIVQFYVRATAGTTSQDMPKLGAQKPAVWIVDDRTLSNQLRRQRFVVPQYERDIFNSGGDAPSAKYGFRFPRLSNHYVSCTFIHNETDVYYGCEIRKSGSPWTRSGGSELSRGKWKTPNDRIFRGRQKSTFDNDAESGNHNNRIVRYWLYVLGHPVNENEFVYNVVNGDNLAIREDVEPCDGELPARVFPGGGKGQVFRSDDQWWFIDDWNRISQNADWSYKGTDNPLRYHTEWMMRSREAEFDYSALIDFFRNVSGSAGLTDPVYRERVDRMLDPDLTLMMAAVRGYIFDWDSLTLTRGKNGYMYRKPTDGRLMFFHWDSDIGFGNATQAQTEIVVGNLAGWATYISKPWNRRTLNYWLSRMLDITTGANAARTTAWLDAEEAASSAFGVNKPYYETWMTNRAGRIVQEINLNIGTGGAGNANSAAFAVSTTSGTTSANSITITGTAPAAASTVVVDGHPEAVFTWTNQTTWTLSGILLREGVNNLFVRMLDHLGNTVGSTIPYTFTKTGNAPPAMRMVANPASFNAALGEPMAIDASGSFDPEGTALAFGWSVSPSSGFSVATTSASQRIYTFTTPGIYTVTLTGTDGNGVAGSLVREISVFNAEDFESFGSDLLGPIWTKQNIENRDSDSPNSWYSVEDISGRLHMQTQANAARPVVFGTPTYPALLRPLPATANWTLQTELTYDAKRTGNHMVGLQVEISENGTINRYVFGPQNGTEIAVKRTAALLGGASTLNSPASAFPLNSTGAVLRIRRNGGTLNFERRVDQVWSVIHTVTLGGGNAAISTSGGVFMSTTVAENLRIAFDYLLLSDTSNVSGPLSNLRISEIMYAPATPSTVEFIELTNTGTSTINLAGCKFANGDPFDEFVFPSLNLSPGAFVVVTNSAAAFTAKYGASATIAGEWGTASGLNNTGETVVLLDADGNEIHNFSYSSLAPWPTAAVGTGASIEVLSTAGNYGSGTNWRASFENGGSPGFLGLGPDSDGDGQHDSQEVLFGTDPNNASSRFAASLTNGTQVAIAFPAVNGRQYRIEYRDTMAAGSWQTLQTITATSGSVSVNDTTVPKPAMRFYRVIAL